MNVRDYITAAILACMKDTDVICFDEPTSGLDYSSMVNVSSLLHELAEQGKTLLVTTHDYEFLMHTCTHICYLLNGRVESFFPVEPRYTPQIYSILFQKEVSVKESRGQPKNGALKQAIEK